MRILSSKLDLVHVPILQVANASLGLQDGQTLILPDPQQTEHLQTLDNRCDSSQALLTDSSIETRITNSGPYQARPSLSDTAVTPCEVNFGFARSLCEQDCDCACHRRGKIRTPACLNTFLGSLFVGYSINPWMTRECDSTDCQGHSTFITFTYAFPQWLLNRMMRSNIAYDQSRGPELCIRVVRVRSEKENIFRTITGHYHFESQRVQHLKFLLTHGKASILDVDPHGSNALTVSIKPSFADNL